MLTQGSFQIEQVQTVYMHSSMMQVFETGGEKATWSWFRLSRAELD